MFVCHGNICRSPMAEFVMKEMLKKTGFSKNVFVASSATSTEEIGNPVHSGTVKKLLEFGISTEGKYAVRFTKEDYANYDYIIGMDTWNVKNLLRMVGGDPDEKIYKLLDFAGGGDIADPWYTGNFDDTYDDVVRGCKGLMKRVRKQVIR